MIERLKKLGLSELEARCYLELHEESNMSGYEVAKRVSVSRTNVYAALRSLADKGMCRTIEGDPVLYAAVPIEQVVRYLRSEFDRTADVLVSELKPPKAAPAFYNWQGEDKLRMAAGRLIASAQASVVVDIWAEDLPFFEEALAEAESRGVSVLVVTLGPAGTRLKNVFVHKRMEWPDVASRSFSILCDGSRAILGAFGESLKLTALETDHPSIAYMLLSAFYHDLIMMEAEKDFGPQLAAAYGEHYEKITGRFRIAGSQPV
ncbi:hypothetical protein J19TS2_43730 [Cohnella xylanilytica]|uniref:TrmB family transcriptional regulator n=1 Tax=Cohnella xylanilytica TaxID=557555 RepID=A0A841U3M6_9BACL|nr:TrmB family transcriptional regulator [Cohnella xylanilytica]MBB6692584.1 TrmB family transcriptional regulator [Cohnella xylanilytica]GIO14818.1 hypothetical protein J19TS2_43730 [Cohnella xylanilytica]